MSVSVSVSLAGTEASHVCGWGTQAFLAKIVSSDGPVLSRNKIEALTALATTALENYLESKHRRPFGASLFLSPPISLSFYLVCLSAWACVPVHLRAVRGEGSLAHSRTQTPRRSRITHWS